MISLAAYIDMELGQLSARLDDLEAKDVALDERITAEVEARQEALDTTTTTLDERIVTEATTRQQALDALQDVARQEELRAAAAALEERIAAQAETMRQAQRDIDLLWDLHRQAEHLGDKSFLTSNYKRFYSRSRAAETPEDFWRSAEQLVAHFYKKSDPSMAAAAAEANAKQFMTDLRAEVVGSSSSAPAAVQTSPAWQATRCWTAAQQDPVYYKEWCGLLNRMIREDDADLMPGVCKMTATMAGFNVSSRMKALPPIAWPSTTHGNEMAWTLTRGGRMPDQHVQWYEANVGGKIRIPMNLATTKDCAKSKDFMNLFSYPADSPKVMFYLELDEHLLCDHVNCLEALTLVPREQEFLFPPYSCFTTKSVERLDGFTKITLSVSPDNSKELENLPVAPWA